MPIRHALTTALFAAAVGTAHAATLSATLEGSGLSIDSPCAISVAVTPDNTLHGQAVVEATAEHQEEIDHLLLESRGNARIHTHPGNCWKESFNSQPTLVLSVRVPAAYPLTIDESGFGRYTIGAVGGTLSLDLSGAADVTDASATSLHVDISGNGNLHVARADGPASIELSGHGDITVDQAAMPNFSVDLSGAGRVAVTAGHIGRARLEASGAGHMQIGAEVDDAHVDLSGVGSVHFSKVNGQLTKEVSGFGSVTVE